MKSRVEIEKLSVNYCVEQDRLGEAHDSISYIEGYTQCREDMLEILGSEIRRAYIHGQGNAQGMAAGLERDEVEDYTNWRMLSLTKK